MTDKDLQKRVDGIMAHLFKENATEFGKIMEDGFLFGFCVYTMDEKGFVQRIDPMDVVETEGEK